jgi:predicted GNAT family acetyltransferase
MSDNSLNFTKTKSDKDIQDIYNFNVEAFADAQDFDWSVSNLKKEIKEGWNLYSVTYNNDIVAALFVKADDNTLFTKNTPIKMNFQGNGFSHMIKDFYEEVASDSGLARIVNYCPFDNFRMISLNERHDYKKTGNTLGDNSSIIEWEKNL